MPHPYTAHYATATSPLKLFEYMASQRPIVASDLPGWSDVIADGDSALLVPPGDVDALTKAIKQLLDNPEMRVQLADHAHARVMADFTWEARAKTILDCLSDR
jgi:glycosyltransferase involved in cell wall biosynthesis